MYSFFFTEMAVSTNEVTVDEGDWKDIWLGARGGQFLMADL
jgi:hypothetical protein